MAQNIWHENLIYDPTKFTNDWIILKLDIPLDFNEDVYSACLPLSSDWSPEIDPNNRCFVSGWGHLEFEGYSPDNLQWVEIPAVNIFKKVSDTHPLQTMHFRERCLLP